MPSVRGDRSDGRMNKHAVVGYGILYSNGNRQIIAKLSNMNEPHTPDSK